MFVILISIFAKKTMKKFLLILLAFLFFSCNKKNESTFPLKKDIVQTVYASGKVYPENVYNVYSKLPGYVSKIFVNVGDTVYAGQTLLSIKSEVSEKNMEMAKNQLKLATVNISDNSPILKAIKEDVQTAFTKNVQDSTNFQRYLNVYKSNASSQLIYEQSKTQFEISRQNYIKALNNLEQKKNQLKLEYENAKLQYEAQQSNFSEYNIVSAIHGKVYDIIPKEGEFISNAVLLVIGNKNKFEVELFIDETDISLLKPQQKIVYEMDAYPNKIFYGKVKTIYQRINPTNKTCRVLASMDAENYPFLSGMSVEANIIISEKKQALVIPKNYLLNDRFVINKNHDTLSIKKGIEDIEYVEITDGINEKTELIMP